MRSHPCLRFGMRARTFVFRGKAKKKQNIFICVLIFVLYIYISIRVWSAFKLWMTRIGGEFAARRLATRLCNSLCKYHKIKEHLFLFVCAFLNKTDVDRRLALCSLRFSSWRPHCNGYVPVQVWTTPTVALWSIDISGAPAWCSNRWEETSSISFCTILFFLIDDCVFVPPPFSNRIFLPSRTFSLPQVLWLPYVVNQFVTLSCECSETNSNSL